MLLLLLLLLGTPIKAASDWALESLACRLCGSGTDRVSLVHGLEGRGPACAKGDREEETVRRGGEPAGAAVITIGRNPTELLLDGKALGPVAGVQSTIEQSGQLRSRG